MWCDSEASHRLSRKLSVLWWPCWKWKDWTPSWRRPGLFFEGFLSWQLWNFLLSQSQAKWDKCCTLLTRIWNFFDLEFSVPNARTFQASDRFWLLKLGKPVNWHWVQSVSHRNWLVTSSTVCTVYSVHCSRSNGLGIQVLQLVWDQEQGDSSSNLEFIWSDSLRLTFPKKLAVLESSLEIPNLQLSLPSSPQRMDGGTLQTNEVNSSMWGLNTPIWCRG